MNRDDFFSGNLMKLIIHNLYTSKDLKQSK